MRILHARLDVAGQPALLAHAQRALGHAARCFAEPHPFGFKPAPDIIPTSKHPISRRLALAWFTAMVPFRFEVIHFHSGSFLPPRFRSADAKAYRRLGRKVIVEFWGSDARLGSIESTRNPFYILPSERTEAYKIAMLEQWALITDGHVVFPDHAFDVFLKPYFDHVHIIRHCVDTRALAPLYPDATVEAPLVVHAPSNRELKGTAYVRNAIDTLRDQGLDFRYLELNSRSHNEVLDAVREADIVVDQLVLGSHGILAVEAMSLGKPVICYILPELVPTYPEGFPIINADPLSLAGVLSEWLRDADRRASAGRASRAYAERVHDAHAVAAEAVTLYQKLP